MDIAALASEVLELLPLPLVALEPVGDAAEPSDLRIVWANPLARDRFGPGLEGSWLDRDRPFGEMESIVAETRGGRLDGRPIVVERSVEQDGTTVHLRCTVLPADVGAAVILEDATSEIEARQELAVAGSTLERVERWGNLGVWEVELRSNAVYWSTQVYEILGVEDQSVESYYAAIHPEDRAIVDHVFQRLLDQPGPYRLTHRIVRDGEVRTLDQHMQSVPDASGRPVRLLGTMIDVTAAHALQQRVHEGQQLRTIGLLAGGMAHDLANAVFVMRGHADVLLARRDVEGAVRESVEAIARGAEKASTLTRRFMALGRRDDLRPAPVDLFEVAEDVCDLVHPTLRSQVSVRVERANETTGTPVLADAARLRQTLLDLVFNARDAGASSITLRVGEIVLGAGEPVPGTEQLSPGRYGSIDVVDDGAGMDPSTVGRAFDAFFTTKAADRGSGLGLANVQDFAVQSLGAVAVSSTPGEGTTMSVLLPLVVTGARTPRRGNRRRARRVLVGAPSGARHALAAVLAEVGAQLVFMEDLDGVAYSLATEPIDAVVLDEALVPLPGWPPVPEGVPVVLLTTDSALHPGATASVDPTDAAGLVSALEDLLGVATG